MKVLTTRDLPPQMVALCEEAAGGEVIRVQLPGGALLEIKPVDDEVSLAVSSDELAQSYADKEWSEFESHCGRASD